MSHWTKKYQWRRTWPGETDLNGKPCEDYCAHDGEQYAGRIRLELNGPTKGKWQWAGSYPRPLYGSPLTPNVGYCATAAEAAEAVERYWDASKAMRDQNLCERTSPSA